MQTTFSLWLEPPAQVCRAIDRMRRICAEQLTGLNGGVPGPLPSPLFPLPALPPWIALEGSYFTPRKARALPFWALDAGDKSRIIRRDRSGGKFSSPTGSITAGRSPELVPLINGEMTMAALVVDLESGVVPDLREFPFGSRRPGGDLADMPEAPVTRGLIPMLMFAGGSQRASEAAGLPSPGWMPDESQRKFSRCSIHALRLSIDPDRPSLEWESLLQVDLARHKETGV
jgi:hypothetical protein